MAENTPCLLTQVRKKLEAKGIFEPEGRLLDIYMAVLDKLATEMKDGKRVEIRGFGSFNIREYEPYLGRNPKTKKNVMVERKKMVRFRPGRLLAKMVKESSETFNITN